MESESSRYSHLNLSDWPFRLLPSRGHNRIWAGRPLIRKHIEQLTKQISEDPTSSLHLMWADFGAGKTHCLFHMESLAEELNLFPVYVEWPNKTVTFVDVYRNIAQHFSLRRLTNLFWACCERRSVDQMIDDVYMISLDFAAILERLYNHDTNPLIHEWLRAQLGITRRELAQIGVRNPIKTSDDAVTMLTVLVKLVAESKNDMKMLLMLDEFQRTDQLSPRVRADVNTGIRHLLNACPESLSVILSFSFGKPDNINFLLTPDVITLADHERINIPKMKPEEAEEFFRDLLKQYRIRKEDNPYFPFTEDSSSLLLGSIDKLIPRRIMKRFSFVLRRVHPEIRDGKLSIISKDYVKEALKDMPIEKDNDSN